jgi:hypothetical protein
VQGDLAIGITERPTSDFLERYDIPDGSCAAYHADANPLIPLYLFDRQSGTPAAKGVPVVLKGSAAD